MFLTSYFLVLTSSFKRKLDTAAAWTFLYQGKVIPDLNTSSLWGQWTLDLHRGLTNQQTTPRSRLLVDLLNCFHLQTIPLLNCSLQHWHFYNSLTELKEINIHAFYQLCMIFRQDVLYKSSNHWLMIICISYIKRPTHFFLWISQGDEGRFCLCFHCCYINTAPCVWCAFQTCKNM